MQVGMLHRLTRLGCPADGWTPWQGHSHFAQPCGMFGHPSHTAVDAESGRPHEWIPLPIAFDDDERLGSFQLVYPRSWLACLGVHSYRGAIMLT